MRIFILSLALILGTSAYAVEKKKVALIKKAEAQTQIQESLPSDRPSDGPVASNGKPEGKEDGNKEDKKEKAAPACVVSYANGYLGFYKCEVDGQVCYVANGGSTAMHCK